MAWQPQHVKLSRNPRFCVTEMVTQLPGDKQRRAVLCMPLRKLPGWLATIHPDKVRPELRETIIAYQNECDDVLWAHWERPRRHDAPVPPAGRVLHAGDLVAGGQLG